MKYKFPLIFVLGLELIANAQFDTSSRAEYESSYRRAFSKTYEAFPSVLRREVELFQDGKLVETYVEVQEIQAFGVQRNTMTSVKDGRSARRYSVSTRFDQVYCSEDGSAWTGPQKEGCFYEPGSLFLWVREGTRYSVSTEKVNGENVKVYKEDIIYAPTIEGGKRHFAETLVTIDPRGFLISVVRHEGTLGPRTVLLSRHVSIKTNSTIKPIIPPAEPQLAPHRTSR